MLARLPHSHIDPNWPPTVPRESRSQLRVLETGSRPHFQPKRIGNEKSACIHRFRPEQRAGIGNCLAADGPGFRGSVSRIGADQVSIGAPRGRVQTPRGAWAVYGK
jgi:hypothetical protein